MRVHIKFPKSPTFVAHARRPGHRNWEIVGKFRKSKDAAAKDMLRAFLTGDYKRAIVALYEPYYDPVKLMEIYK